MSRWKRVVTGVVAGVLSVAAVPAAAERIETYWLLTSGSSDLHGIAPAGTAIMEQRLLPAKLVRTKEPLSLSNKTIAAGTYLYMIFNHAKRVGYCTLKDRSSANQVKTLFIPILDQRPCFVDRNGDGRLDGTFSVFDKYGGPPSVRGSIDSAEPLSASAAFTVVDRSEFPLDMRMSLHFTGSKKDIAKARIAVRFDGAIKGNWEEVRGVRTLRGTLFTIGNVQVILLSLDKSGAKFEARSFPDVYISTNNQNTLFWDRLPAL